MIMNFLTLNIDSRENSLTGAEVEDSSGDIAMLVEISTGDAMAYSSTGL